MKYYTLIIGLLFGYFVGYGNGKYYTENRIAEKNLTCMKKHLPYTVGLYLCLVRLY